MQVSLFAAGPLTILLCMLLASPSAQAASISFQISNPLQTITSGGTVVFTGTVTNDSGSDLFASDFFFNFFNFNPVLTPTQLLGTPDFLLANSTTSPVVDLFNVTAGSVVPGPSLFIDATLQDIFSDVSRQQTVNLTPSGGGAVPEPPTSILLASGIALLFAIRLKSRLIQGCCTKPT
jgi:hypothetical protein